ncbi:hydantoinase B/oxoprolinase family protein [Mesorhizobium sp. M0571]|uniref:hydantoinase B/oxoprolinase family protein n=1 Tax=Mesorhizobium sp. M0571 TaxID=2956960 RepID=UPI00333A4045
MDQPDPKSLDPITVEVVRHKLDGIANEMEATLFRSAFSTIVKEARDASASLFTVEGETLAQAIAIPIHLTTLIPMVKAVLESFPREEMRDGDAYILNDPYTAGGTHLPDFAVVTPIFHDGEVIALAAALAHHQDVGGMTPGSTPTNATEIYQEGIRVAPMRLVDAGNYDHRLVRTLRLNVRLPDIFNGDLNAQLAACKIGQRRIQELADKLGAKMTKTIFADLLDRSERLTRAAISALPDGEYQYVDYLDNDGIDLDAPIRIEVKAVIKGDSITFDFTGTNGQVRGPFNCMPSGALCGACFAVRAIGGSDIPTNGGCFRPIQMVLPVGSLVNPLEPAPLGCRTATIKRLTGVILGAVRQAAPKKIPADSAAQLVNIDYGGSVPSHGRFVMTQVLVSGSGASMGTDGVDVIETDATNTGNVPVESVEMESPLRIHRLGIAPDSGGAGKQRGGLGCYEDIELLEGEVTLSYRGERHFHAPAGADGGLPGEKSFAYIIRADQSKEIIKSKIVTKMNKGDRLVFQTAGGGGFGKPEQRDRKLLTQDVFDGKVSRERAIDIYKLNEADLDCSRQLPA